MVSEVFHLYSIGESGDEKMALGASDKEDDLEAKCGWGHKQQKVGGKTRKKQGETK